MFKNIIAKILAFIFLATITFMPGMKAEAATQLTDEYQLNQQTLDLQRRILVT